MLALDLDAMARIAAAPGRIIVAVSGGGDSVALLRLLARAIGPERLLAVAVDHGVRPEARGEAEAAARAAHGLGAKGLVVSIEGAGAGHDAWRRARHRALCAAARDSGASVIALGHTLDDQAETVLIRAAAGSGLIGLAAMRAVAPSPVWPEGRGITLVRPLLGLRRAALRDRLRLEGAAWRDDPANDDPKFDRARARRALAALDRETPAVARLAAIARRIGDVAARRDTDAAALLANVAAFEGPATAVRSSEFFAAPAAVADRALQVLLAAASGREGLPEAGRVSALRGRLSAEDFSGATLGGASVQRRGGDFRLSRDPGAVLGRQGLAGQAPLALTEGTEAVWDGRLAATALRAGITLIPAVPAPRFALGDRALSLAEAEAEGWLCARWLGAERAAQLLFGGDGKIAERSPPGEGNRV
ncbi:MAG: tRNA lysidine(34) synthetase TilS [Alphaproteobacteria bacterium]|nr:tRNA lysidine(34) synthetase TilS [Alphaproteobacteria bacterium]